MDFCSNGSIRNLLDHISIPEKPLQWIVQSSLQGIHYLHSLKPNPIIHRDIKSANILITEDLTIKIADFGVSDELSHTICARNTIIGTPFWMAPEVITGADYNTSADIWSLGITVLEMAEGIPPLSREFPNPMRAMFKIPFREPPTLENPSKWSKKMAEFIQMCLKRDPKKRSNANQLLKSSWIHSLSDIKQGRNMLSNIIKENNANIKEGLYEKIGNSETIVPAKKQKTAKMVEKSEKDMNTVIFRGSKPKSQFNNAEHQDHLNNSGDSSVNYDGSVIIHSGESTQDSRIPLSEADGLKNRFKNTMNLADWGPKLSSFISGFQTKRLSLDDTDCNPAGNPMLSSPASSSKKSIEIKNLTRDSSQKSIHQTRSDSFIHGFYWITILALCSMIVYYKVQIYFFKHKLNYLQQSHPEGSLSMEGYVWKIFG